MKPRFALLIAVGLAFAAPIAMTTTADAASNMERNAKSGTNKGEGTALEAASPGVAANARYHGRSGWRRHHHRRHHHRR